MKHSLKTRLAPVSNRAAYALLVWIAIACPSPSMAQGDGCAVDLDQCVRQAVLETAAFVDACAVLMPSSKAPMDAAFASWTVRSLPVPGLPAALEQGNPERAKLRQHVMSYLKRIPAHEVEIECGGRWEMMKSTQPRLVADSVDLPPDALARYRK